MNFLYYFDSITIFLHLRLTQKALQLPFQFFICFLLVQLSGQTAKIFLAEVLRLVIKKGFDHDLTHSLDKPKNILVNIVTQAVIRDACGT